MYDRLNQFYRLVTDKLFKREKAYQCQVVVNDESFVKLMNDIVIESSKEADSFAQMSLDMDHCEKEKRGVILAFKNILSKYSQDGVINLDANLQAIIDELASIQKVYANYDTLNNQGIAEESINDVLNKMIVIQNAYDRQRGKV